MSFGELSGVVSITHRFPSDEKVVTLFGFVDIVSRAVIAVGKEETDKALDLNFEGVDTALSVADGISRNAA